MAKTSTSWGVSNQFNPIYHEPKMDTPEVKEKNYREKYAVSDTCVKRIFTEEEYRSKLKTAEQSDQMLVLKYVRENCPACAVVSVAIEKLCKKYTHYNYMRFYEISEDITPVAASVAPKTPHLDAYLGTTAKRIEINAAPDLSVRREAMERIENLVQVEEMKGATVAKEDKQKMMMKALVMMPPSPLFSF
eukprot:TRINITY_DN21140_c0_g1_i2.p1 TRINITY_DN21140_c0_g1~~TRINITY_DN21140_c0_g1_i2.p1  ORF type:complete len:207 (+),score=43.11 TRINITY_DN21140_c0_g1_i2:52-621(+)